MNKLEAVLVIIAAVVIGCLIGLGLGWGNVDKANQLSDQKIQKLEAVIDGYEGIAEQKLRAQEHEAMMNGSRTVSDAEYEKFLKWELDKAQGRDTKTVKLCATESEDKTVLMVKECN